MSGLLARRILTCSGRVRSDERSDERSEVSSSEEPFSCDFGVFLSPEGLFSSVEGEASELTGGVLDVEGESFEDKASSLWRKLGDELWPLEWPFVGFLGLVVGEASSW